MHAKVHGIRFVMIFHVIFAVVIEPILRTQTRFKKKDKKHVCFCYLIPAPVHMLHEGSR